MAPSLEAVTPASTPAPAAVSKQETPDKRDQQQISICVRGCCRSERVRLDVPKGAFQQASEQQIGVGAIRELARGAESVVWSGAWDGQPVAIKRPFLRTADDMTRFHKEIRLLELLGPSPPHIAPLVAARAHPPDYALALPLHPRGSLHARLHAPGAHRMSFVRALHLAADLARGLCYLHEKGVVHRDVKPANVLLSADGAAVITDFGLAEESATLAAGGYTETGARVWVGRGKPTGGFQKDHMVGTMRYLAPEVLKKHPHSPASDVYSWAITANETCTQVLPFTDLTTQVQIHTVLEMDYTEQALAEAIASHGLRPPTDPHVPQQFKDLLTACWQQDPAARPSAAAVVKAMQDILRTLPEELTSERHEDDVAATPQQDEEAASWADRAVSHAQAGPIGEKPQWSNKDVILYRPVIAVGVFASSGAREKMEDRHCLARGIGGVSGLTLLGIFDGHRGFEAAEYASHALPARLPALLCNYRPEEVLSRAFVELDAAFCAEAAIRRTQMKNGQRWHPGCTALAGLLWEDQLVLANAGDCRAVVSRAGKAVQLTRDHTVADEQERARVVSAGSTVEWRVDTWRVGAAALQVSRSIGDDDLKPAVTAEPEVTTHKLTPQDEFLILASDGLWDVVSNEEAVNYVKDTVKDPHLAGKRLAAEAGLRDSEDNITIIVVFLTPVSTVERVY
eukprot:jgi/Chlat1/3934/Chrsp26S04194